MFYQVGLVRYGAKCDFAKVMTVDNFCPILMTRPIPIISVIQSIVRVINSSITCLTMACSSLLYLLKYANMKVSASTKPVWTHRQMIEWPWEVKVIAQNKWYLPISWPSKQWSRNQNYPKCFSSKVMVKNIFFSKNGGQRYCVQVHLMSTMIKIFL